ncbi:hypothetical protein BU24DRAFT_379099 [Aaosphaeria arxii CBS 175.79]|uniref:Uncharacterized protein n=1 Tax=Aaosphaeria arxii CBS 175.79 TaxID=1450172 RepID=A0A6A5XAN0_9PLEO|nr:uncharacterized protein BU24DRAFT_379099 [Aaosphaeria arxii CBS 175.79]KAF2009906.1 hypothetical protein BU24DRAFT_379099 [Aaosphaeria arxii CBS 175.79]
MAESSTHPNRTGGEDLLPDVHEQTASASTSQTIDVDSIVGHNDEAHEKEIKDDDNSDTEDPYQDDPIVAEYKMFLVQPKYPTYVLQYIDRPADQPVGEKYGAKVIEMRVKPTTGFFEVDVALDIHHKFDRVKAVRFGEALRKTKALGQQGYGMAVGFGRVMPRPKRRGAAAAEDEEDEDEEGEDGAASAGATIVDDADMDKYVNDFEDANDKGHVLNYITYGGRAQTQEAGKPVYMCGVFRGDECHLHKITGFVRLSTEYHHFDAIDHLDIVDKRKQAGGTTAQAQEPKAVVEQPLTGGPILDEEESFTQFMKRATAEPWERLQYNDQDSPEAWHAFSERMFLHDTENAVKLVSPMTNEQYVESLSAVKGTRQHTLEEDEQDFGPEEEEDESNKKKKHVPSHGDLEHPIVGPF